MVVGWIGVDNEGHLLLAEISSVFIAISVNLGVPCLCYEIPKNPSNICILCYFSHLRRRFTDDS